MHLGTNVVVQSLTTSIIVFRYVIFCAELSFLDDFGPKFGISCVSAIICSHGRVVVGISGTYKSETDAEFVH